MPYFYPAALLRSRQFTAFLMQISTLIISPAFLAAGNYVLLSRLILILGKEYIFLHPSSYTFLFVTGDVISLVIQAVGGGIASSAPDLQGANNGGYIMVGGVMFQMVVMLAYTFVLTSYIIRWKWDKPCRSRLELLNWWPDRLCNKKVRERRQAKRAARAQGLQRGGSYTRHGNDIDNADTDTNGHIKTASFSESRRERGLGLTPNQMRRVKIMLGACAMSTLLIFIRS